MTHLYTLLDHLVELATQENLITPDDRIYCRNQLLHLWNVSTYEDTTGSHHLSLCETLDALADLAVTMKKIEDITPERDRFTSNMMNVFLDKPSTINQAFQTYYNESPEQATHYFYDLSKKVNYIKTSRIAKNKSFKADSPYGPIQLTINLSKPEKDPKQIALAKNAVSTHYPKCLLCIENEGFEGTTTLPDRSNHRMIRLNLNEKSWMLQYSPYLYYEEHCILLSASHEPMCIGSHTFKNLLCFVEAFPHYFLGSNADLPIVGGSILSHEHYQGGRYDFPMNAAQELFTFSLESFPDITCKTLHWPLSTIRLRSPNIESLVACSTAILESWRNYSDPAADILAYSEDVPHNTITPIAHKEEDLFVMDLVLRNNRTTDTHPLGIFHPHQDVHHIKKENIGLIEVMGLAILPGRLLNELEAVKRSLSGPMDEVAPYHLEWATQLKAAYTAEQSPDTFIQQALGEKFVRVLEDAGVFKLSPTGINAFRDFTNHLERTLL